MSKVIRVGLPEHMKQSEAITVINSIYGYNNRTAVLQSDFLKLGVEIEDLEYKTITVRVDDQIAMVIKQLAEDTVEPQTVVTAMFLAIAQNEPELFSGSHSRIQRLIAEIESYGYKVKLTAGEQ